MNTREAVSGEAAPVPVPDGAMGEGETLAHCGYVGIFGRTNVGKSTLLNRVLGTKVAICTPRPQTTRRRIRGILQRPDAQVVIVDTPGVHRSPIPFNQTMVDDAIAVLGDVDLVWFMIEAGGRETERAEDETALVVERLERVREPVFLVINKVDTVAKPKLLPLIDRWTKRRAFAEIVPVSARTGDGVELLVDLTLARLGPGPAFYPRDVVTDQELTVILGELVRERVLTFTRQEVPHAVAVSVDEVQPEDPDVPDSRLVVRATIHVERDSQKAILIGRGGQSLKRIGTDARHEMVERLGRRVHLELFVRVEPDWRRDRRAMQKLGY